MSHLEEGLLHALLDGEVPSRDLPPIQAHLAACPECRARLEEERALLADADAAVALLEVPAQQGTAAPRPGRSPSRSWRGLAWAASLVGAVGLGYVARGGPPDLSSRSVGAPEEARADSELPAGNPQSAPVPAASVAEPVVPAAPRKPEDAGGAGTRRSATTAFRSPGPKTAADQVELGASDRPRLDSASAVVAQTPAAAPAAVARGLAAGRLRDESLRRDEVVVTGVMESKAALPFQVQAEPISLPDAVRRLGGTLRLIEGLVPLRLEAKGAAVRVVYPSAQGELILSQELVGGRVVATLIAPPEFPADSLATLRARVRE